MTFYEGITGGLQDPDIIGILLACWVWMDKLKCDCIKKTDR